MWPSWWRCTVQATKARWFSEVQASVAKWTRPECSLRRLPIHWRHFTKELLMSRETVIGEGSMKPGQPAFNNVASSRSLTILGGQLLSAHHLTIWALKGAISTQCDKEKSNDLPDFFTWESMVGYCSRSLARTRKGSKDWPIARTSLGIIGSSIDDVNTKAPVGVCLQVWCCRAVLGIKVSPNTPAPFASICRTSEKVKLTTMVVLDINLLPKEAIDWRTPTAS